jgi:type VI secretion system protein ImpE
MTPYQLYQESRLDDAIETALREVKTAPADADKRLFLCDLLCMAHQLERADRQLDILAKQDVALAPGIALYRQLIRAEHARTGFFESGAVPEFMAEVPESLKLQLKASIAIREGNSAEARGLLEEASAATATVSGECDGQPFDSFRDLDDMTAPFMEALTSTGKYYWLPWEVIESLEFLKPRQLRDLVWRPAQMSIRNGPDAVVYVPVIYAGSHTSDDPQLRTGKSTDWVGNDGEPTRGVGQRTFLAGEEDRPILSITSIRFNADGG